MDFMEFMAGEMYCHLPQNVWIGSETQAGPYSVSSGVLPLELQRLGLVVTFSPLSSAELTNEEAITRLPYVVLQR